MLAIDQYTINIYDINKSIIKDTIKIDKKVEKSLLYDINNIILYSENKLSILDMRTKLKY